jgi:signal transduction histidine kinase
MRARAEELKGELQVRSAPAGGTEIVLVVQGGGE